MPSDTQLELLVSQYSSVEELLRHIADKNDPVLARAAIRHYALAIDIESDGERIWEIGTANWKAKSLLLSRNDPAGRLHDEIQVLGQEIGDRKLSSATTSLVGIGRFCRVCFRGPKR